MLRASNGTSRRLVSRSSSTWKPRRWLRCATRTTSPCSCTKATCRPIHPLSCSPFRSRTCTISTGHAASRALPSRMSRRWWIGASAPNCRIPTNRAGAGNLALDHACAKTGKIVHPILFGMNALQPDSAINRPTRIAKRYGFPDGDQNQNGRHRKQKMERFPGAPDRHENRQQAKPDPVG